LDIAKHWIHVKQKAAICMFKSENIQT